MTHMPDDDSLQARYGPATLDGLDEAPPEPTLSERLVAATTILRSLSVNLLIILGAVLFLTMLMRELTRDTVVIEPISVPPALSSAGWTGEVAAHQIWNALQMVQEGSETRKQHRTLLSADRQLDVTEPGSGLSFRKFTAMLRELLGVTEVRITGEFLCADRTCAEDSRALSLRVFYEGRMVPVTGGLQGQRSSDVYLEGVALRILRIIDPYVVAAYQFGKPGHHSAAIDLAYYLVESGSEDSHWAANMIGNSFRSQNQGLKALEWYDKALEIERSRRAPGQAGMGGWIRSWLNGGPEPFALPYFNAGVIFSDWGDHDEAMVRYRLATQADPAYVPAYVAIATNYLNYNQIDAADAAFAEALKHDGAAARVWRVRGRHLLAQADKEIHYARHPEAYGLSEDERLAHLSRATDHRARALQYFRSGIAADPTEAANYNDAAAELRRLGDNDGAIALYRQALERAGEDYFTLANMAHTLDIAGDQEGAIAYLERALIQKPDREWALSRLATLLERAGDFDGAAEVYARYVASKPNMHDRRVRLGQLLGRAKKYDAAWSEFRAAADVWAPNNNYLYNWRGVIDEMKADTLIPCQDVLMAATDYEFHRVSASVDVPLSVVQRKVDCVLNRKMREDAYLLPWGFDPF